jgi:hypothetical protein
MCPHEVIEGVEVIDCGGGLETWEEGEAHVRQALGYLMQDSVAWATVRAHLRKIVLVAHDRWQQIDPGEGKYAENLGEAEGTDPFLLSCRLLWGAHYMGLLKGDAPRATTMRAKRDASFDVASEYATRWRGDDYVGQMDRMRRLDWRVR